MVTTDTHIHTPVSMLMTTDFAAVAPWDTLGEAVERMTKETGSALVIDYGRLVCRRSLTG
jgi:hypothetical protein